MEDMQHITEALAENGGKVGLRISTKKTKLMLVNVNDEQPTKPWINDTEKVDKFTYLGSTVTANNQVENEIKTRISKATANMNKLSKVWKTTKFYFAGLSSNYTAVSSFQPCYTVQTPGQ